MARSMAEQAAETITKGIGRRGFIQAVAALGAGVGIAGTAACSTSSTTTAAASSSSPAPTAAGILQPGAGDISGDHYLSSEVDKVLWGLRADGRVRIGAADEVRRDGDHRRAQP